MSAPVKLNDLVANGPGSTFLRHTARVLSIGYSSNHCWLIYLPARKSAPGKERQTQDYLKGPFELELSVLYGLIESGEIVVLNTRLATVLSDADRLAEARARGKEIRALKDIQRRDRRYEAIRNIVFAECSTVIKPPEEILGDSALSQKIAQAARDYQLSTKSVHHYLHLFWAGGSTKSALCTRYEACGSPGESKAQRRHLGRKPRLFNQGLLVSDGYALTDQCKQKLAQGFRLIKHGTTERDAYLMTMSAHWAEYQLDERTNQFQAKLFAPHLRPTKNQFIRWGRKLNETTTSAMLLGLAKQKQKAEARGGSEQDLVVAVGQLASFDATSTDVYLTRLVSRLKKLPPMTRMILKEMRTGLIYGIYCGWEPPSPATALQTILHGASPDKQAWAKRFGVDMPDGAMPAMLARAHLADNGELKGVKPTEAEEQFGFGVDIAPTRRGDRKGGVESEHHAQHKHVDHKLPGSTRGKRPERGDVLPVAEGLLNYYEYMRELIEHIIEENTRKEVPDLAPDDFLLQDPPIAPTRINIYQWLTERGMNRSLAVDYDALKAFCLPDCDAVVMKNGIYLEAQIHGRKQRVPRLRFTSDALVATGLLSLVKQTGSPIHTRVKLDQTDLSTAWLPTKTGLIQLFSSARDTTIHQRLSLTEWLATEEERSNCQALSAAESDQRDANTLQRRASVYDNAKAELNNAIKASDRPPSRAESIRHLRKNRADEMAYLNRLEQADQPPAAAQIPPENSSLTLTPAELVMDSLQRSGLLP